MTTKCWPLYVSYVNLLNVLFDRFFGSRKFPGFERPSVNLIITLYLLLIQLENVVCMFLVSGLEIKIKKNNSLTDNILDKIAQKYPSSLTITQCNGKRVTVEGLRNLFRTCADSLQVFL